VPTRPQPAGRTRRSFLRPSLSWLLALIPVSVAAEIAHAEVLVFFTAAGAILPLAGIIGQSTEQIAAHAGPRLGGFLNATFGNVAELIISVFLILDDEVEVVKASLTGSILGNLLLVLGLSFFVGGLRHREQRYNAQAAGVHSTSLTLAVIGLLMPALFVLTTGERDFLHREVVSGVVAGLLILLYVGALAFMMVTHQDLFRTQHEAEAQWSLRRGVTVLVVATAFVALESEFLVGALDPAIERLGLSKFFVGLIVVPIVGNAAEHGSAVLFAARNKVDITLEIATGSSTQIALFVAPALVFISLVVGHPMDFIFTPFEIAAVGVSSLIAALISLDGKSNWLEGAQLMAAYLIIAISFFFVPTP
jgi:Ca2+:H+ antiporter